VIRSWILNAAALIVLSMGLTACSNGDGGEEKKPDVAPNTPTFDTKSCVYKLTDGQTADLSLINQKLVETVSFNKTFNATFLRAIGNANIPSSIEFINLTDATVYQSDRAPTEKCTADLFGSLPRLTTDLQSKWNEASPKDEKSILLGLYLPKDQSPENDMPSVKDHAALIVRTNVGRWTLVHEFMHHLFMLDAVENGYDERVARQQLKTAFAANKAIADNKNLTISQQVVQYSDNYVDLVSAFDSQMIHFTLEEMTIEKTLKEYLAAQKLGFAPPTDNWYIHSSGESARETFKNIKDFGAQLIREADKLPGHEASAAKVRKMNAIIDSRLGEITKIQMAYPLANSLDHKLSQTLGLEGHSGCSHENDAQELLELSREL